jgi:hypothetical protein
MKALYAFTFATMMFATPAHAGWKLARCMIDGSGNKYQGPCYFQAEKGGSFTLKAAKPYHNIFGAMLVTVAKTGPEQAEVRGLTDAGINSRWGDVRRSRKDRACWVGDGMTICAW